MKKGGPAPVTKGHKQETVGASASTQPKSSSEPSLTKAEVAAIVEKTVSDALARQMSQFQAEITKSTKQQVQDASNRLQELGDKSLEANASNTKRFKEVEDTVSDLKGRCELLEKLVKENLDGIVEEKVRLILRKIHPDSELEEDKKKWSEQLARSDSVHQEEIQKLQQQHHQDMLSVINDCCRKLKTGFTRHNKPYDVGEIHIIIDDIEQKMIREILSEIQKTDTHGDLSSFGEALTTSKLSHEVYGESKEFNRLSSDEITASLDAFGSGIDGNFAEELESVAEAVAIADYEREPVVEENIAAHRSMITGDRGNVYYAEELKRTVDDMIALGGTNEVNPIATGSAPELPPKTRTQSEFEESLESMIISGDTENRFEADIDNLLDVEETNKSIAFDDPKLDWPSNTRDILRDHKPEKTHLDADFLKSLETTVEGDLSWTDIQPSSKVEPEDSKSHETAIHPVTTTSAKAPQDQDRVRSVGDKTKHDQSAVSAQDRDQMKALEDMLEAQMIDSPDAAGKSASLEHSEPTKSSRQQLKANVSDQVTSSALQKTETIKATPKTGYGENPHYVEEVLNASAKGKP